MKRSGTSKVWWFVAAAILIPIVLVGTVLTSRPPSAGVKFVSVDHPVDMQDSVGGDRWAYFSMGEGTVESKAEQARKELIPLGFKEDTSERPWYQFVKGNQTIVICAHHEFAVNGSPRGSKLVHPKWSKDAPMPETRWPCVLIKNGEGTKGSLVAFQINKLVRGWLLLTSTNRGLSGGRSV